MTDKIYKIREFNEFTGQILITADGYPYEIVIDLPLDENNNVPIGEDLHRYINGFVPYSWIERTEKLKNSIANAQLIKDLVEPLPVSVDDLIDLAEPTIREIDISEEPR